MYIAMLTIMETLFGSTGVILQLIFGPKTVLLNLAEIALLIVYIIELSTCVVRNLKHKKPIYFNNLASMFSAGTGVFMLGLGIMCVIYSTSML